MEQIVYVKNYPDDLSDVHEYNDDNDFSDQPGAAKPSGLRGISKQRNQSRVQELQQRHLVNNRHLVPGVICLPLEIRRYQNVDLYQPVDDEYHRGHRNLNNQYQHRLPKAHVCVIWAQFSHVIDQEKRWNEQGNSEEVNDGSDGNSFEWLHRHILPNDIVGLVSSSRVDSVAIYQMCILVFMQ